MKLTTNIILFLTLVMCTVVVFGLPQAQSPKSLKHAAKPVKSKPTKTRERVDKSINEYIAEVNT